VNRQFEEAYYRHFGWPYYWAGPYLWGPSPYPMLPAGAIGEPPLGEARSMPGPSGNPHLRSTDEITGYHLRARDGEIGHVEDFLFDRTDWSIHLMVVDTRKWLIGKHVLMSPRQIERVSWEDRTVFVSATKEQIERSPEYDEIHPPESGAEVEMYRLREPGMRPPSSRW